jgi:hypothetical protein
MSATTTDITGNAKAFSSFLRIPVAGYRDRESGSVSSVGSGAYLWSRSAKGVDGPTLSIAVASNWDSQEAGEGFSITSNIRRSSTHSICRMDEYVTLKAQTWIDKYKVTTKIQS